MTQISVIPFPQLRLMFLTTVQIIYDNWMNEPTQEVKHYMLNMILTVECDIMFYNESPKVSKLLHG